MSASSFANSANAKFNGNIVLNNGYLKFPNGSIQTSAGGGGGGNVSTTTINTYTNTSINNFEAAEITCFTQPNTDNSTFVATTEFVQTALSTAGNVYLDSINTYTFDSVNNFENAQITCFTQPNTDNSTFVATTKFVQSKIATVGILPNNNTGIGNEVLQQNTTGNANCAFGAGSLSYNINGVNNCAFGYDTLTKCSSGGNNSAFGTAALFNLTTGNFNTGCGIDSLYNLTIGESNSAFGSQSGLYLNNNSFNNTFLGNQSGPLNGDNNIYNYLTCIGSNSTPVNVGSDNQIVLGSIAGNETIYIPNGNIVLGNNQSDPNFTFTLQPTFTDLLFVGSGPSGIPSTFLDLSQPISTMSSSQFIINSPTTIFNGNVSIPSPNNLVINDVQLVNQGGDPAYTTNAVLYLNSTAPVGQQLRVNINGTKYSINLTAV